MKCQNPSSQECFKYECRIQNSNTHCGLNESHVAISPCISHFGAEAFSARCGDARRVAQRPTVGGKMEPHHPIMGGNILAFPGFSVEECEACPASFLRSSGASPEIFENAWTRARKIASDHRALARKFLKTVGPEARKLPPIIGR